MDIILVIISALFMVLGLLGSLLPVLPGPPLSWLGLLLLQFTKAVQMSTTLLVVTGIVAVVILILDYMIPAIGTKKFGGSKSGMIGTSIGLVVGILAPIPGGIILGPFIGAFIGEMLNKNNSKLAFKAALGSFFGFLASTFMKFIVAVIYLGIFLVKVWEYKGALFAILHILKH
ncbi:MAG: DUF456 domain-containing protein [Flavobacteriales bacterium]|nr:DUF456 domain-containing protein [Flavobacteriia bacterium]NCP52295.1 DUF456 domain-containing protein [Flavobacteriales bacterium]PIV94963.1 MAG: DUF456 domain-containing protein [Flavobacteriaceae bacterium CG17_big_fil_post_rev_8_21_14_2_50_33_15]PJB19514.1 MAG: DUF456 domain-containing protein [Flavobacteriaceae bacterium CG_4_9_14_3_um_filter_33_16]NCP60653.1 DUF456 domain-containing protein [Flavobacteriales bacterium]